MKDSVKALTPTLCVCIGLAGCSPIAPPSPPPPANSPLPPSDDTVSPAAQSTVVADQYVITEAAEVRLGPNEIAPVTNTVYRGQAVKVYETMFAWSRISEYYDGSIEGETGQVARWIRSDALASERPTQVEPSKTLEDSRIRLPLTAGNGLTERDLLILHAAARYYLETGRATGIEDGDKSISKPNTYYLNFSGETNNTFFRPSEIPDLERRIRELSK